MKTCITLAIGALVAASPAMADTTATVRGGQLRYSTAAALTTNAACPNVVEQAFPLTGAEQTRWRICWRITPNTPRSSQLVIGPVSFRKAPDAPFVKVLHDVRVAEIHVPYFAGYPRFLDISTFSFSMDALTAQDCPSTAGGTIVGGTLCIERRDRGILWHDGVVGDGARRGEEVTLWSALEAANYVYIQSYAFRDDGTIVGRLAATGQNYNGGMQPHAHNGVWRLDFDVGGTSNRVDVLRHVETMSANSTGSTATTPVATAGKFDWKPQEFTTLSIGNTGLKNAQGIATQYELQPIIEGGLSRHSEPFSQADFWVTPYDPGQLAAASLPSYIAPAAPVRDRDLVVWLKNTALHHPRTEDGVVTNGKWVGTTLAMWSGFMLMPHDLFDCAPLYVSPCPKP